MWLCTSSGFLSTVAFPHNPSKLLVRARRKGDIESLFPKATVQRTPGRDYLYRAVIDRKDVAKAVYDYVMGLDYGNYKSSVEDDELHTALMAVWNTMSRLQAVRPYGQDSAAARAMERRRERGDFYRPAKLPHGDQYRIPF